jgi:tetratricopeptide (TPR) repeat protein
VLAPAWWWRVTRTPVAPLTPVELAREGLPRLLARVQAEPRSAEARFDLASCYTLLDDRLGAWQQLVLAEREAPLDAVRRMRIRAAEALGQHDDAAQTAERAWGASPDDLPWALELYRLLTLQADFEGALAVAREALARHPADSAALAAAGEAYFNLARYPQAIRHLKAAAAAAPGDLAVPVQLGLALLRTGRNRESVGILESVVKAPTAPPQAWEFLGEARAAMGQNTAADASFRRAEAAGALGGAAAFGRARVAMAQGRASGAETALTEALAREPAHEAAAATLARLLRSRGERAEAAAVRGRAALAGGDAAEAVDHFREAAALEPREVRHWRELARARQAAEDGQGALDALRRAQALAPEDADLAAQQIETALAVFAPQEALRACGRYAALSPAATAEIEWGRFRAYRQLLDVPRASAALQAGVTAAPDRPEFLTWQGRTLLETAPAEAEVSAAERALRRARELRPADAEILASLAEVCVRQQRWEEAGALLRRAIALDPASGSGSAWLQLARVDRALGRTAEARWDTEQHRERVSRRAELERRRAEATAHPRDGTRHAAWAEAALRAGSLTETRVAARSATRLAPADPHGYQALAAACQRQGRLADRIAAMEAVRRLTRTP